MRCAAAAAPQRAQAQMQQTTQHLRCGTPVCQPLCSGGLNMALHRTGCSSGACPWAQDASTLDPGPALACGTPAAHRLPVKQLGLPSGGDRRLGAQVRVVRIFNTYGPRMALDDGRVVSNFLAQALTGQPMTVYGDGSQSRSFQFVSDLVEGAALLAPQQLGQRPTWVLVGCLPSVLRQAPSGHCRGSPWMEIPASSGPANC